MKKADAEANKVTAVTVSPHKKIELTVGVLAVVVIMGIGIWGWHHHTQTTIVDNRACPAPVLQQASADFDQSKIEQLQQLTNRIKVTPGNDKDVNCLYIVATYYTNISDSSSAQANLNRLEAIDPKGDHLNVGPFYKGQVALDKLQSQIDFVKQQQLNPSGGVIPSETVQKP